MKTISSFVTTLLVLTCTTSHVKAEYMIVDAVIKKQDEEYVVLHKSSDKPQSFQEFGKYLEDLENRSVIGLKLTSRESIPIKQLLAIFKSVEKNAIIEILDIQLSFTGKEALDRKIQARLKRLNDWDKEELDLHERPQAYANRNPSGETNGWISSGKDSLRLLGVEKVIWNAKSKLYELCTTVTKNSVAVDKPQLESDAKPSALEHETGLAKDIRLIRKTYVRSGETVRFSSPEAIDAASNIFRRLNFVGMSKEDIIWILGDPKTICDNALPAQPNKDSDLIYRFDNPGKGYDGRIKFNDGQVASATFGPTY